MSPELLTRLFSTVRGAVRGGFRRGQDTSSEADGDPRYGVSVSYTPCASCGEGTMRYDPDNEVNRCTACGVAADD